MSHERPSYPNTPPADSLTRLVTDFSAALLAKLQAARVKYGYGADQWLSPDWREECLQGLAQHVAKGDPRDVAAYCAFAWYHGWSTPGPWAQGLEKQRQQLQLGYFAMKQRAQAAELALEEERALHRQGIDHEFELMHGLAQAQQRAEAAEVAEARAAGLADLLRARKAELMASYADLGEDHALSSGPSWAVMELLIVANYCGIDLQQVAAEAPGETGQVPGLPQATCHGCGEPSHVARCRSAECPMKPAALGADKGFFLPGDPAINPFGPR